MTHSTDSIYDRLTAANAGASESERLSDARLKAHSIARARAKAIITSRDDLVVNGLDYLGQLALQPANPERPLTEGNKAPQGVLVVCGQSGAGKTHTIRRALAGHHIFKDSNTVAIDCPVSSTSKGLAIALLREAGYPAKDHVSENRAWDLLRERIQETQIDLIWIDEFQHVLHLNSTSTLHKTRDALKFLTIDSRWPTSIIISGLSDIQNIYEHDAQLMRRKKVVNLPLIDVYEEPEALLELLEAQCQAAGILLPYQAHPHTAEEPNEAARLHFEDSTILPLIVACQYALGTSIDLMIDAIRCALSLRDEILTREHFALAFRLRDDVNDNTNPFVVDDWRSLIK